MRRAMAVAIGDLDAGREGEKTRILARTVAAEARQCWLWRGPRDPGGYGTTNVRVRGAWRVIRVHRLMFLVDQGYLPAHPRMVAHDCGNRACVNPAHLYDASHAQNMADKKRHGTAAVGDRNGTRVHPERVARGDAHYSRQRPDALARGDRNGARVHREQLQRGEAWQRSHAEEVARRGTRPRATGYKGALPLDQIQALAAQGKGYKRIARELDLPTWGVQAVMRRWC